MITSEMIAAEFNKKEAAKAKIQQAQGTLQAIKTQLDACTDKMKDLGVTPETIEQHLLSQQKLLEDQFVELSTKLDAIALALKI